MMSYRTVCMIFMPLVVMSALSAGDIQGLVVKYENISFRSVILKTDGTYFFCGHGNPLLTIIDQNGLIKGGFDISRFENSVIPPKRRRLLTDIDRIPGVGVYGLLVGAQFEGKPPETMILKFQDSEELLEPVVIPLEIKIAGDRIRVDSTGNVYILGLAESDFEKIIMKRNPGECPLLHKFNPKGEHIYSTFVRYVDPSPGKYMMTYTSPILAASNFIISPKGDVWILWHKLVENQRGWPDSSLFEIDSEGEVREISPAVPETGYILTGLVKNVDSLEVLFEWKRHDPTLEIDTILTDSYGAIISKGCFPGKILSINDKTVLTTAYKDGKHALIKYTY